MDCVGAETTISLKGRGGGPTMTSLGMAQQITWRSQNRFITDIQIEKLREDKPKSTRQQGGLAGKIA